MNIPTPQGTGRRRGGLRRALLIGVVLVFLWVIISRLGQVDQLVKTLREGEWQWVVAAAALQVGFYSLYTLLYQAAFSAVNVTSRWRELAPLVFVSVFVNTTVTSGGTAGAVLFVDDAARRGESPGRATAGTILVTACDYAAFLVILTYGLVMLVRQHDLTRLEGISALIMYLFVGVLASLFSLGLWWPQGLHSLLHLVGSAVNTVGRWIGRPNWLHAEWATATASEFTSAATAIAQRPWGAIRAMVVALLAHIVDLLCLYALFAAFHQPVTISILITLYAMTILFWIVSPTPNGVGVVETVMPLIYASVNIPIETGAVITLAFRGLGFWIPMFVGFVLLHRLHIFQTPPEAPADNA